MKKGTQVRQNATGRLAEVVKSRGSTIFIVDSCGSSGWYPTSDWTEINPTGGIGPLRTRAPLEEEKIRAMLESIVHEADADIWSEKDSKRVLVRRESIEAARKLLKLK